MKITAEFNNVLEVKEFIEMFGQAPLEFVATKEKNKCGTTPKGKDVVKEELKQEVKEEKVPKVEAEIVNVDNESTEPPKDAEVVNEDPKVTKEMVRATFTKLIKAGKQKEAKELTLKYGASKLGEVKEEDYAAIYKDAEELL